MRAIVLREFGPPERLEPAEVPDPAAAPEVAGEVSPRLPLFDRPLDRAREVYDV
jgi:hypothetical protein